MENENSIVLLGVGNILLTDEGLGVHVVNEMREAFNFTPEIEGFLVSLKPESNPKSIGLMIYSVLESRISKCKCGPSEAPVLPEIAIHSPFLIGISPGFKYISISKACSL